jgi:O-antigen ligase
MTSALPVSSVFEERLATKLEITSRHQMVWFGTLGLLLLGPLAFGATEPWSQFVLEFAAACLLVLWAMREAWSTVFTIRWAPALTPMLVFGLMVGGQLVFHQTTSVERTFSSALLFAAYFVLCFLLVQSVERPKQLETAAYVISVYGVALAIFALIQDFTSNGKLYWLRKPYYEGWIYGPYVNHNHYAGLMEMMTPIPLVVALSPGCSAKSRWLAGIAASTMATSILFSQSRGGMIGFTCELLLTALLLLRHTGRRKMLLTLAMFLCATLLLAIWLGSPQTLGRLETLHSQAHAEISDGMRLKIDRDALEMFAHRPFFGWGLGSFTDLYPQFRSFYTNLLIDHAHNDYLEFLVETGLAGALIALWFLVTVFRFAWEKPPETKWQNLGLARIATLVGITGILIHGLVDFNLQIPANAAIFYGLCTVATLKMGPVSSALRGERYLRTTRS